MKRAIVLGTMLLLSGRLALAQEPEPEPETFQTGEIQFGVAQTDSNTLSSKFLEYREVPDGVFLPNFRLKGEKDGLRYEAFGGNVQQTDQFYGLRLGKGAVRIEGDYNRIPHNFGNAGHTLLEQTSEGVLGDERHPAAQLPEHAHHAVRLHRADHRPVLGQAGPDQLRLPQHPGHAVAGRRQHRRPPARAGEGQLLVPAHS